MDMKGKLPAWSVLLMIIFCWIMETLPYLIPSLNTIEPIILGFPFTVMYQFFWIVLGIVISIFATAFIWDNFEGGEEEDDSGDGRAEK